MTQWGDLSKREQYATVRKVSEIVKNYVFMTIEKQVRTSLYSLSNTEVDGDDTIEFKLTYSIVWNDVLCIVGGMRRRHDTTQDK